MKKGRSGKKPSMTIKDESFPSPSALCEDLEQAFNLAGIEIRYESLSEDTQSWGGKCQLQGKEVVILDQRLDLPNRNRMLLKALKRIDLEGVYLKPYLREMIEEKV